MRTTLNLPEDLHHIVASLAAQTRRSLSVTAVDLMRRGLADGEASIKPKAAFSIHTKTGLPVVRLPRTVTPEDIKALEDEA